MNKKMLVTGVNGFVGQHVARELHGRGIQISGVSNQPELTEGLSGMVDEYAGCDLTNPDEVSKLNLDGLDAVINLAGIAVNNPNPVGDEVDQVMRVNVLAHTVLYDRLVELQSDARIVAVSTGAIYNPNQEMPLNEESAVLDREMASAYIRSKLELEENLARYKNLDIVVARPFNHTGPGQQPGFLVPDWAERILAGEPLDVSRLDSWRDFSDVRDVAKAYAELATSNNLRHDIYNIASGTPRLSYDVISLLARELDVELPGPRTEGESVIYASHERLTADTGWQPSVPIEQTIKDFAAWKRAA